MDFKKEIKAYALKNAIEHCGKAQAGAVVSGLFNHGLEKSGVGKIIPEIQKEIKRINSLNLEEQEKEFSDLKDLIGHRKEREGLPELENVKANFVVRFSPSPSGPMHIGHAITGMYSSLYAKKYKGKFYFRIEDTNPENIAPEAYKMLKDEADWLFGNVTEYIIQSDRMKEYYNTVEKLIGSGDCYVCTCEPEEFKELMLKKKACDCRDLSVKEQKERWKRMLDKKGYKVGEAVVRFKADLKSENPALRDFPLARINETKHPRQGKKYRVWPLMNLSVTVDDIEFKTTHAIRGKDHEDNAKKQKMMYKALKKDKAYPTNYFIGRYKFTDLEISATKTKEAIKAGRFSGWEDIRLPFMESLKKRGFQREAFEMLVIEKGLTGADKVISKEDFFENLAKFNREIVKGVAEKLDFEKLGEKKANSVVLMPSGEKVYGKTGKAKKSGLYYISGIGYARCNGKTGKIYEFWFAHR